jgi:hypothetical protein
MAKVNATVQFDWDPPLAEFHVQMSRFGEDLSDFTDLFAVIGGYFKQEMAAEFVSEGETSGSHWKELSDNPEGHGYKSWKERKFPGRGIGFLSGALIESLTGGAGYTEIITPLTAEFGQADGATAAAYGEYFAEERPVLRFTPQQGEVWQKATHRWVIDAMHHVGGAGALSSVANAPLSDLSYSETLPST